MLLFLIACTTGGVLIDEGESLDGDGAADTDPVEDSDVPPPDPSGSWSGAMAGLWRFEGGGGEPREMPCEGEASFTVDAQGGLTGTARCQDEWNDNSGEIVGTVGADGAIEGVWTFPMGWAGNAEVPFGGAWDGADGMALTFEIQDDWYEFDGDVSASR
jgi:hypothetical protein